MPLKPGDPPVQDPPANPPVFDPEAFTTKLLGELDKRTNAIDKKMTAIAKAVIKEPAPAADPNNPPADPPAADPPNPKIAPEINAELQGFRRKIAQLEADNKKANDEKETEKKARLEGERVTAVRNALNEIPFRTQAHRDLFFNAFSKDIKRDDDGNFIAETGTEALPMLDYLKNLAESTYADMLAPKGGGGAGAHAGTGTRKLGGPVKMTDLTPEKINALKPAEHEEMMRNILAGNIAP